MTAIIYDKATSRDLASLLAIENQCFTSDRISPRQMGYLLSQAKASTLVARSNQQVVGYGLCLTPALPRPARLYSLAVLPQWRRRGIAAHLVAMLKAELLARNYSRCRLEVRCSDQHTQDFYQSMGFSIVNRLPAYYQDGENGLRMECILEPSDNC